MLEIIPVTEQAARRRKLDAIQGRNVVFDAALLAQVGGVVDDVVARAGSVVDVELGTADEAAADVGGGGSALGS